MTGEKTNDQMSFYTQRPHRPIRSRREFHETDSKNWNILNRTEA